MTKRTNPTNAHNAHSNSELFSFGIVCYRNWEFLTQTIDSVLMQDYSPIQLIVSDDGSGNFPIEEFENYIETHKGDNIVSYIVRESEQNEGTVRHLNHVLECAEGEYYMTMAADDTLDNPHVFSDYVKSFHREGKECGVVMGQTAMYDLSMTKKLGYFVWPDVIDAINHSDSSDDLIHQLFYMPCVPTTSTCYRRWVLEKYGPFDTSYSLVEDYPFHIKLAKAKVKMCYENYVTARHRDGGISHGAVTALSRSKQMYLTDCINARKEVVNTGKEHHISPDLLQFNKYHVAEAEYTLLTTGTGLKGLLQYAFKHPIHLLVRQSRTAYMKAATKWLSIAFSFMLALLFLPELTTIVSTILPFLPPAIFSVLVKVTFTPIAVAALMIALTEIVLSLIKEIDAFPVDLI